MIVGDGLGRDTSLCTCAYNAGFDGLVLVEVVEDRIVVVRFLLLGGRDAALTGVVVFQLVLAI